MNAERLHVVAKAVKEDLINTNLEGSLSNLAVNLQNQISQPNAPQHQQNVSTILTSLYQSLERSATNDFPPTWRQALSELGADILLGHELRKKIEEIFSRNQITPSVAQIEITAIHTKVNNLQAAFNQILEAFSRLSVGADDIEPGRCELGILIPRQFVNNNLAAFGEEISELNKILGVFAELATGSRPDFKIRTVSSSDFTVFLDALPEIGACLAIAVERVVALYKQLLEIRKLRNELKSQGVPPQGLEGVEGYAAKIIDDGIDTLVSELMKQYYKKKDDGRKHELNTELKLRLKEIAARIDRGYNLEIRVKADPKVNDQEGGNQDAAEQIAKIQGAAKALQFMKQVGEPILSLPEVPEVHSKKPHEKKKQDE